MYLIGILMIKSLRAFTAAWRHAGRQAALRKLERADVERRPLVETCKLYGVDPQAYFADVLTKLVNLWPASRLDELMPWAWDASNWIAAPEQAAA
jgi:hypothetical protein